MRGVGVRGGLGGGQGRQRKKSHLCGASSQARPRLCVVARRRVATEASGSPTVCLFVCLFVVDPWSCCLFIIRPPHCEDAASVRHSINNPESSHAIQEPRRPLSPTRNGAGLFLVRFIPTFSFHYFLSPLKSP